MTNKDFGTKSGVASVSILDYVIQESLEMAWGKVCKGLAMPAEEATVE